MEIGELEQRASRGEPIPDGLSHSQIWLYERLRALYHQYRIGAISRDVAAADKKRLLGEYQKRSRTDDFREKQLTHAASLWSGIESAGNAYAKEHTLEHADRFYHAVYGVGVPKQEDTNNDNS